MRFYDYGIYIDKSAICVLHYSNGILKVKMLIYKFVQVIFDEIDALFIKIKNQKVTDSHHLF